MRKIIEKYFQLKLNFDSEGSKEMYDFLNDLSRYAFCEVFILSSNEEIFLDFIKNQKQEAIANFDKYYGIIDDYNLDIYRLTKDGQFFTSLWQEVDGLLMNLYWRSITRGKPSQEQKEKILELLEALELKITNSSNYMKLVLPKLIQYLKKEAIIQAVIILNKTKKKLDRRNAENFLAARIDSIEELKKNLIMLINKKNIDLLFEKIISNEEWYFGGGFQKTLQNLLTNNMYELKKTKNTLMKLKECLENNEKDEKILKLVYEYRRQIYSHLSGEDAKFYNTFINEHKISFKHSGTYLIPYLKKPIDIIQNSLDLISTGKEDDLSLGYEKLSLFVSDLKDEIRSIFRKHKVGYKIVKQTKATKGKKRETTWVQTNEYSFRSFLIFSKKLLNKEVEPITNPTSLILCFRKCSAFMHLLSRDIELTEEETQEVFSIFTLLFLKTVLK